MTTRAIFLPFDLFGNPGTKAGAELLADAFQELLDDNKRERVPTRARAYANKVRCEEHAFATLADYQDWRAQARKRIREVFRKKEFLLWITGNHLGALPLYEELGTLGEKALIVQLDAHLDIYHLSACTSELSHGNFLMHAEPRPRVVNLGHRELLLKQAHIRKYFVDTFSAADLTLQGDVVLGKVGELCKSAEQVYIDLDCDFFDPAYFPAVAQARPFGMNPLYVLRLLDVVGAERLAGFCISEFDPARDERDRCLETLMWLIEYVLLLKHEKAG